MIESQFGVIIAKKEDVMGFACSILPLFHLPLRTIFVIVVDSSVGYELCTPIVDADRFLTLKTEFLL
jgi:hypothetical protein